MTLKVSIIALPYNQNGKGVGGGAGPASILDAGLVDMLRRDGLELNEPQAVQMTAAEEAQYGDWNRVGLANGYLARMARVERDQGDFVLGLLANCNGVVGLLGGMQTNAADPQRPLRVGLIWIDAHGDYNVPNTSPSGMLGGMPVAISAGKCLPRLRKQSGLRFPLQSPDIVMMGLRDLDDLERRFIEEDEIITHSDADMLNQSPEIDRTMAYFMERQDVIYVHVDLDILNPELAPAAGLPTPGGLSGLELGKTLRHLLKYPKVKALALVSYSPHRDDADFTTRQQVITAIREGMQGILDR